MFFKSDILAIVDFTTIITVMASVVVVVSFVGGLIWNLSKKISNNETKLEKHDEEIRDLKDTKAEKDVLNDIKETVNSTEKKTDKILFMLAEKGK